jgi:hypothetical protein
MMHNVAIITFVIVCFMSEGFQSELWSEYTAEIRAIHHINLTQRPDVAIQNMCGSLDYGCIAGTIQTYSTGRLNNLQNIYKEHFSMNGENGTMTTNLFLSHILKNHSYSSRVCLFGDIHIQSALFVLMYCKSCHLVLGMRSYAAQHAAALGQLFPDADILLFQGVSPIQTRNGHYLWY